MPNKSLPDDLSVEDLRRLLVEKRRSARQERLERFRRTGRVVSLASDAETYSIENMRSSTLPADDGETARVNRRERRKRILNSLLLLVEVSAVIGLGLVLVNGLEVIRELNREVAVVLEQPTLTSTPLITAIILPSGHTPPGSPGGSLPNDAEIPEHLQPLVQSLPIFTPPTPGPEHAIRIQVPAIGVDAPIVQGDGWEQLKKGVGQHIGTANPGEESNLVLTAHNDIFGEIFRDLDQLKTGDQVIVYSNQRAYAYVIMDSQVVEPTRVEVMTPTTEATITLISCYPYRIDNKRIVVVGKLQ